MILLLMAIEDEDQRRNVEQWYNKYYAVMRKEADRILKDRNLSDDMVNEAFVKIIRNYEKVSCLTRSKMAYYFVNTIRSVSIDYIRRTKKDIVLEEDFEEFLEEETLSEYQPSAEEISIGNIGTEVLEDAIEKLSDTDRQYIIARYAYELSDSEISKMLGVKERYVHTYVRRACNRLKKILEEEGFGL